MLPLFEAGAGAAYAIEAGGTTPASLLIRRGPADRFTPSA